MSTTGPKACAGQQSALAGQLPGQGLVPRRAVRTGREKELAATEEALRRSEANLAKAQQIAHLGSYEIEIPFSKNDYRSDEIFRILGLNPGKKELSTEDYIRCYVHPADQEYFREVIAKSVREAGPFDFEYRVVRLDGSIRYVHSMGEPVLNVNGVVTNFVGTLLDITERKELENALLDISDREQRRIGQDLHDGLGQHLAGIELMSRVLEQNLAAKQLPDEAARAGKLAEHVREAIRQTRLLARGLAPVNLESQGLMSALQELADNTRGMFGVDCRFCCETPVPIQHPSVATHLYRIAQEAVSNAVKHGRAKEIEIHLQEEQQRICLAIKDNGQGIPREMPKQKGMGLRIMQYRAGIIGGTLSVEPGQGGGTEVICSLQNVT